MKYACFKQTPFYGAISEFHRLSSFVLAATWTFRDVSQQAVLLQCLTEVPSSVSVVILQCLTEVPSSVSVVFLQCLTEVPSSVSVVFLQYLTEVPSSVSVVILQCLTEVPSSVSVVNLTAYILAQCDSVLGSRVPLLVQ